MSTLTPTSGPWNSIDFLDRQGLCTQKVIQPIFVYLFRILETSQIRKLQGRNKNIYDLEIFCHKGHSIDVAEIIEIVGVSITWEDSFGLGRKEWTEGQEAKASTLTQHEKVCNGIMLTAHFFQVGLKCEHFHFKHLENKLHSNERLPKTFTIFIKVILGKRNQRRDWRNGPMFKSLLLPRTHVWFLAPISGGSVFFISGTMGSDTWPLWAKHTYGGYTWM